MLGCHACNVSSLGFHCLKLHMQLFWYSTNLRDLMDALVISIWYESDYTLIKIMRSGFKTIKKMLFNATRITKVMVGQECFLFVTSQCNYVVIEFSS